MGHTRGTDTRLDPTDNKVVVSFPTRWERASHHGRSLKARMRGYFHSRIGRHREAPPILSFFFRNVKNPVAMEMLHIRQAEETREEGRRGWLFPRQ
jgi:hypothetical protein